MEMERRYCRGGETRFLVFLVFFFDGCRIRGLGGIKDPKIAKFIARKYKGLVGSRMKAKRVDSFGNNLDS